MDGESVMQSTTNVPPAWDPRLEKRGYPFRIWMLDVAMWRICAEIPENRQGAAVAQRFGGVAKISLGTFHRLVSGTARTSRGSTLTALAFC